jgi:cytochrome c oxidase cbb3-type subunit III
VRGWLAGRVLLANPSVGQCDTLISGSELPGLPSSPVSGKRRRIILIAVAVAIALVMLAVNFRNTHALKVRFLMADPDSISRDARMLSYAIPRGRTAFDTNCAGCHGRDLQGDSRRGIPDLIDTDWLYGSGRTGEIERIVLYGIRSGHSKTQNLASMPAFGTANPYSRYKIEPLKPQEVADVAAFIFSFQHHSAVDSATVIRGTEIYRGKGLCFDCHADHANGDSAIGAPNLVDSIWLYGDGSLGRIKADIERGLAGVCPQWSTRLPPETIRAIAVYVQSRSAASVTGAR